jgi:A/G-specific adenine glycosylase
VVIGPGSQQPKRVSAMDAEGIRVFQEKLLQWYDRHGRDLPWRHTRDPYRILVSEMMLQQTQVDRVLPKYREWLAAYPTFEALATAPLAEVKRLWQPLGYNFRPERLHQIAQFVKQQGQLPETVEGLRALPGIGPYTAGAILSFAFHQDAPMVDTNIQRVILRMFGIQGNPLRAAVKKRVWQLAETLLPKGQAYIFNQALMDFGALLCTARNPRCSSCFNNDECQWNTQYREGGAREKTVAKIGH